MDAPNITTIPIEHSVSNTDGRVRGIVLFVTDPDTQLTDELSPLGESFYREGVLPGRFNIQYWLTQWRLIIKAKLGFIWLLMYDGKPVGAIGVLLAPDLCDADLVLTEAFWYVMPDHRGGSGGIRLLKAAEKFAEECGAKRILMARHHAATDERLDRLYEGRGYFAAHTTYCKVLP
jgi:GNAT superfamily N-acetyltransferase